MQTQIDRSREGKIPGSGSPGSPGASLGEVRIVVRHEDMKSLKEFGTVQEAPLSQHPKREVHDTSWSAVKKHVLIQIFIVIWYLQMNIDESWTQCIISYMLLLE